MVLRNKAWIRFCYTWSLILSFCITGCFNKESNRDIVIQWNENRATGLVIPRNLIPQTPDDSIRFLLQVHLDKEVMQPAILGEYGIAEEAITFKPILPFTRGLVYDIRFGGQSLKKIFIPFSDTTPEVLAVFPTQDTLPYNLLKIYLKFSKPMREGQSLQHIVLIKNKKDTVRGTFLDLPQELWNNDRTMLTLWLDPGRIKRDLQPNKNLGNPLEEGENYQLVIRSTWKDADGNFLKGPYYKNFSVSARDSISPNPDQWTIEVPKAGTRLPLKLKLHESLDYVLLKEAIFVYDRNENRMGGDISVDAEETTLEFTPAKEWISGEYSIQVQSRLEDLAGNNLNRSFENDITVKRPEKQKDIFEKIFAIR